MTFLDLPQLVTRFSFCFVGEAFDSIKTVTKPSHCLLLDSNHLEILFLFWNKLNSQTAADSISASASTGALQHTVAARVIGAVAANRYVLVGSLTPANWALRSSRRVRSWIGCLMQRQTEHVWRFQNRSVT